MIRVIKVQNEIGFKIFKQNYLNFEEIFKVVKKDLNLKVENQKVHSKVRKNEIEVLKVKVDKKVSKLREKYIKSLNSVR